MTNPTNNGSMKQIRGKPPLAISPRRLRSRVLPPLQEISPTPAQRTRPIETPKSGLIASPALGSRMEIAGVDDEYQFFYPEYPALFLELRKLASRQPTPEIKRGDGGALQFERGRRYDEYAARRNERLMRRRRMANDENVVGATPKRNNSKDLGVVLGSEMMTKRKSVMSKKKTEKVRKSLPPVVDFSRGSVRSSFSSGIPTLAGASSYNLKLRSASKGNICGSTPAVGIRKSVDGFVGRTTRSRK